MLNKTLALATVATVAFAGQAVGRDRILVVGSSTMFPFAATVAERFGKATKFKTPVVERTGSGAGLKLFCKGVGTAHPDVANASRRIKPLEVEDCAGNGVTDVVEIKIGFDGIVIANSGQSDPMRISLRQLFLALAKDVPGPDGRLIPNPYETWSQIDPALPDVKIEVLGPPPTSGTRDAWAELAMEGGARAFADLKALRNEEEATKILELMKRLGLDAGVWDAIEASKGERAKGKDVFKAIAHAIREDGGYVEAGENDNLIVQKLAVNPDAFGIFGYPFLDQNGRQVQGAEIDGVGPEFEAIASGDYPIARSLYFYVKKAHVGAVPGIGEYVAEFVSEKAFGEEGYLADKGLIPLSAAERRKFHDDGQRLNGLKM